MTRPGRAAGGGHLSREALAELMMMAHDSEAVAQVMTHLVPLCAPCRGRRDELRELARELRHWDYTVALAESLEAPALWRQLERRSYPRQLAAVEGDERFQTWGLCRLLQRLSGECAERDPERASRLASLAVRIPRHLEAAYDSDWIHDLHALSLCYLANAWRASGELRSAGDAFDAARSLRLAGTGYPSIEAEALALEALLRRDERRLEEAVALLDRVLAIYGDQAERLTDPDVEDPARAAAARVHKAWCLYHLGDGAGAQALLERAAGEIDEGRQAQLALGLRCGLAWCALTLGRPDAEGRLAAARELADRVGEDADRLRLRRAEARLDVARGARGPAEQALLAAASGLAERGLGLDAALAYLDLAALYLREDAADALGDLCNEKMLAVFLSQEVGREAIHALRLFEEACNSGRLTPGLLAGLASQLEQTRRPSLAWWSGWSMGLPSVPRNGGTGDAGAAASG